MTREKIVAGFLYPDNARAWVRVVYRRKDDYSYVDKYEVIYKGKCIHTSKTREGADTWIRLLN